MPTINEINRACFLEDLAAAVHASQYTGPELAKVVALVNASDLAAVRQVHQDTLAAAWVMNVEELEALIEQLPKSSLILSEVEEIYREQVAELKQQLVGI